jgi:fatty acyl-CoA reductase
MIRPKRNKKPIDRIKNEILKSHSFSVLKRQNR